VHARGILCAVTAAFVVAPAAVAEAPEAPRGDFGGGALVAPPKDLFGAGNAVIGLRAMDKRRLEIEATVRAKCTGGDITATAKIAQDGSFSADGTASQTPNQNEKVTTTYRLAGTFTSPTEVQGTLSATLKRSAEGKAETCKSGRVSFGARKPSGDIGPRGAKGRMRYYGSTAQRGVGPRRPIVLRVSGDGRRISRALFGYQVKCSDGTRSIGVEAPRTEITIGRTGRVKDRDSGKVNNSGTQTNYDDRFEAVIGRDGAKGTLSLSDRTIDKTTGNIIQSCESGTINWTAAP
jgi:hypothetical protein